VAESWGRCGRVVGPMWPSRGVDVAGHTADDREGVPRSEDCACGRRHGCCNVSQRSATRSVVLRTRVPRARLSSEELTRVPRVSTRSTESPRQTRLRFHPPARQVKELKQHLADAVRAPPALLSAHASERAAQSIHPRSSVCTRAWVRPCAPPQGLGHADCIEKSDMSNRSHRRTAAQRSASACRLPLGGNADADADAGCRLQAAAAGGARLQRPGRSAQCRSN
jgi:hypothetical protein